MLNPVNIPGSAPLKGVCLANLDLGQLMAQAVQGLLPMYSTESHLFCNRLKQSKGRLVREGLSHRYTIMTLLGLHQWELAGMQSPIGIQPVLSGLLQDTGWITNIGDLGLLLWLCALAAPERLQEIRSSIPLQGAFERSREVREGRTMELAWFLSGLAHASQARSQEFRDVTALAERTYHLLQNNQGAQGVFGHLATKGTLFGMLRGRIGSFADQVYPIYAVSKFAAAYKIPAALEMAQRCAEAICRLQGPLGQWWWHYDAAMGRVVERYPVYSVHQDAMAPMALFALGEATGLDFREPIYKGLNWIAGNNELGRDLREASSGVIWRSVYHGDKCKTYLGNALGFLGTDVREEPVDDLRVKFECRPYHLGWLLYAFAGR